MARKDSYKIPQRLNSTYWDIEISPSKDGSVPPISMKLIAGVFISFAFCLLMLMESYMQYASTGTKVLFVIAWIIVTVVVLTRDKSKTFRFELVQPLIEYLPKRRRVVWTRKSASAAGFYDIAGIKKIDRDGIISYDDGTFGFMYEVAGSASYLLFEDDADRILTEVDAFFRKQPLDCEFIFMTLKSAQKIDTQVASMSIYYSIMNKDPDLVKIANERYDVLKTVVGKEMKSIHQYMIIKAKSMDALQDGVNVVVGTYNQSQNVFKILNPIDKDKQVFHILSEIYTSK